MIPWLLAGKALEGTVVRVDDEHREQVGRQRRRRPIVVVACEEPCLMPRGKALYWTGEPAGREYLVEDVTERPGGGSTVTLKLQTDRVQGAAERRSAGLLLRADDRRGLRAVPADRRAVDAPAEARARGHRPRGQRRLPGGRMTYNQAVIDEAERVATQTRDALLAHPRRGRRRPERGRRRGQEHVRLAARSGSCARTACAWRSPRRRTSRSSASSARSPPPTPPRRSPTCPPVTWRSRRGCALPNVDIVSPAYRASGARADRRARSTSSPPRATPAAARFRSSARSTRC